MTMDFRFFVKCEGIFFMQNKQLNRKLWLTKIVTKKLKN